MVPDEQKPRALILVSAGLLGEPVRYNGTDAKVESPILDAWLREGKVIGFCPEVEGGCPIPRPSAEVVGCDGEAVLDGHALVLEINGHDATRQYLK